MLYLGLPIKNGGSFHGNRWFPIEIDALPNLKMVDLSMAIAVNHNQMAKP